MNPIEHFVDIAGLPRWVPYKMVWNPKREKWDKIPHTGKHGLSTKDPSHWFDVETAATIASDEQAKLSGVGFVMTGGVTKGDLTLVAFDFDGVNFEKFKLPFETYAEKSPSKTGIRAFAWVPTDWAIKYRDTLDCKLHHCKHAEIYLGTSPRFLTVTLDVINDLRFTKLTARELSIIEKWGMRDRKSVDEKLDTLDILDNGKVINWKLYDLTPDQRHLVDGTGKIDRSAVIQGLLIKVLEKESLENVLTSIVRTVPLWQYCLDHRSGPEERAFQFAKEEIARAFKLTNKYLKDRLVAYDPGFGPDWVEPAAEKVDAARKLPSTCNFPLELYVDAPGLVGEIARWVSKASYTPRPQYSYACALSMVACLIGPYCTHGSRDGKLNLYLTLVGETGYGKNEAFDCMITLLSATDAKDCISDFPASEAALRRQLNASPNILIRLDELSHKLDSMKNNANGSLLGKTILEMYNGARLPSKPYADEKKSLPAVENPFVQIIGGTTDKVWDTVRSAHMEDGTLNRFIFVGLEDAEYSFNPEPDATIPKELKDKLNLFMRAGRMCDLIGYAPPGFGRKVSYSKEVKLAVIDLNQAAWELQRGEFGSLYTRLVQNTMKVAAILAVGDGRKEIEIRDFDQAHKFVDWSIRYTAAKIQARMADSYFERAEKRLVAMIEKAGGRMKMRDAYKQMHISRREMEELIATLVLAETVRMDVIKNENASETEWLTLLEKEGEE